MYEKAIGRPDADRDRDPFEALVDVLAAATRYDLILGIVPIAYAVALGVATVLDVRLVWALVPPALVGLLAVVDALYLHPPVDQGP